MSIILPCSDKFSLQLFSFSFASFHFIYVVIWIIFSFLEEECISWIYDNSRYASWRTEIYHSTAHVGNSQVWRTTCSGKVTVDTWSDAWPRAALILFFSFQHNLSFFYFLFSLQSMPSQAFLYENTHNTVTIEELQKLAPGVEETFCGSFLALSLLSNSY